MEFLLILIELGLLGIEWVAEVLGTSPLFKGNVPWREMLSFHQSETIPHKLEKTESHMLYVPL